MVCDDHQSVVPRVRGDPGDQRPELGLLALERLQEIEAVEQQQAGDVELSVALPRGLDDLLDVGCGPGDIAPMMRGARYVGVDLSADYIERARSNFGHLGRFYAADVGDLPKIVNNKFDVVVATGLLHHIDDAAVAKLLRDAARMLKPGGRLVALDNVYIENQNPLARFVISLDRGQNVRWREPYERLFTGVFGSVRCSVYNDLLRIPYTHVIVEAADPINLSANSGAPEKSLAAGDL